MGAAVSQRRSKSPVKVQCRLLGSEGEIQAWKAGVMEVFLELLLAVVRGPWYLKAIYLVILGAIIYQVSEALNSRQVGWTWRNKYSHAEYRYSYHRDTSPLGYWLSIVALIASTFAATAMTGLVCMVVDG